jgi:hypothetical protein
MAVGPTNSASLVPLSVGDRSRVGTLQGRDVSRTTEADVNRPGISAAQTVTQGEDGRAEPIDDDGFQRIIDQATDRARQSNPNAARGSFVDILV